jgi:hypothetical protein
MIVSLVRLDDPVAVLEIISNSTVVDLDLVAEWC